MKAREIATDAIGRVHVRTICATMETGPDNRRAMTARPAKWR
jgi:hypothetical protein